MKYSSCVYLVKDEQWLFLKRNKKKNDVNHNKYIGVGGKLEENETMEQCARREVFEETGLYVHALEHYGTIRFHYPHFEDEICEIYLSYDFSGTIHSCDEGELIWIAASPAFSIGPGVRPSYLYVLYGESKSGFTSHACQLSSSLSKSIA